MVIEHTLLCALKLMNCKYKLAFLSNFGAEGKGVGDMWQNCIQEPYSLSKNVS
jgi:hypothetical protein